MAQWLTVALLYPGEMGAGFARVLQGQGVRVVTCLGGRSDRTAGLAREAGIVTLDSLEQVIGQSQIIVSLVSTPAAEEVARDYCKLAHLSPAGSIYVDANSTGPKTAQTMAGEIAGAGRDFVDAAINGLARNVATGGTLFLSGARAADVARLVGDGMRVRVLGDEPGQASAMKMLLGGMSKGVCALFLELAALAARREMLPLLFDACTTIYPGMMAVIERMLPTYARHAGRRATEMSELESTIRGAGMDPCLTAALRELHEQLADIEFNAADGANAASLIQRTLNDGLFAADALSVPGEPRPFEGNKSWQ